MPLYDNLEGEDDDYSSDEDPNLLSAGFSSNLTPSKSGIGAAGSRSRTDSLHSRKSSQIPQNRRRKDPYFNTNRFKFANWEDEILKSAVIETYP